ncbi:MAG: M14 family metallopeptidase [Candidatus Marinimicrobia bacterium]|jgi:hypothetical protein|nr:peptidase M14 [Candidatus Neomarinimicrobiota bacterium]MDP6457126.1 M14 family metallopeptidase [Candidatus Neomarinimicrobiota bacterium]MDP6594246.1 M14 family metallopeptidase [Candidatus Neomarinimicrobiota bacterium]MDP6836680.1 M14 family metallopeptidase [Candidatus Neomarinimicrobiota bacterium]|tara:strand:+ start:8082 stop:10646 length:2565 start_codon:yes stop_codon:yes gene_type:complete
MSTFYRTLTSVALLVSLLSSQEEIQFPLKIDGVRYSSDIPEPQDVIGHSIGTRHTRPHQIVEYFNAVAEVSRRVIVRQHATTWEGRRLIHAVVTSPENHSRLESIRENNLRMFDSAGGISDKDLGTMPGIVYLGYSIHGNEASGSEAAVLTLYHLAAGQGREIRDLLEHNVILIDPMLNPDGRDRFVDWANSNRSNVITSDGQDREHNEPWPGGRTNHYWFDLNRDWLPAEHPESNGRIALFHHWQPQLLLDFHEQGKDARYFLMPGIPSRNNPNTPNGVFDLTNRLADYLAQSLEEIGTIYFTKERFDDFYYGKGSTYPDVNGAVGILCEQSSSRSLLTETSSGLLSYPFSIRNHFTTSFGTLRGFADMRVDFLKHQRDFFKDAAETAKGNPVKAYVISLDERRTRAQLLIRTLQKHRVRIHKLDRKVTIDKKIYKPEKSVIIPMNQPQTRFIKAVMETVTEYRDSLFYDVSAWTLPLAYGVRYGAVRQSPRGMIGDAIGEMSLDGGELIGGKASFAYLMSWDRYFAPRALYRILDAGIYPSVAKEPFQMEIDGKVTSFDRGTITIPLIQRDAGSNLEPSDVHGLMETIVREDHVTVYALTSGLASKGPDLGSPGNALLKKPAVAVLSGRGTGAYQVGEVRHLLNEKMNTPLSLLDAEAVKGADLRDYTTLVLVNGSYSRLDSTAAAKVGRWVNDGGNLIAFEGGAKWVVDNKLMDESLKSAEKDTLDIPYNKIAAARGAQRIGGSIFEAKLDITHPVAFGYDDRVALFRRNTNFYKKSAKPGANVGIYTDTPLLSGYISEDNLAKIEGTAAIIARRSGRGSVVLFADNLNFRAFWYGTNGLFLNAVFFGQTF